MEAGRNLAYYVMRRRKDTGIERGWLLTRGTGAPKVSGRGRVGRVEMRIGKRGEADGLWGFGVIL